MKEFYYTLEYGYDAELYWQDDTIQDRVIDKLNNTIAPIFSSAYGELFHPHYIVGVSIERALTSEEKVKVSNVLYSLGAEDRGFCKVEA